MNKYKYTLIIILLVLNSGCSSIIKKKKDINLTIENFNMTQFTQEGEKLYSITSPKSTYINEELKYKLDKTYIRFYDDNQLQYTINSNNSTVLNSQFINLSGNVNLIDTTNERNKIYSNNAYWDVNNSEFVLEGDVKLKNNFVDLKSSKAFLDKKTNIIKFFKPVKYKYNESDSPTNFNVSSDNAFYDLTTKSLLFKSVTERIKSKITF